MNVRLTCYDEPAGDVGAAGGAGDAGAGAGAGAGSGGGEVKLFDQEAVNRLIAEERRRNEVKLNSQKATLEAITKDKTVTEQLRQDAETQLNDVRGQLNTIKLDNDARTKRAEEEFKKGMEAKNQELLGYKQKYITKVIESALKGAVADGKPVVSEHVVDLWSPRARLVEEKGADGKVTAEKVVIDFKDEDENGNSVITIRTPAEAVARSKELKRDWHLWEGTMKSGAGGFNSGFSGNGQPVDVRGLKTAEYMALRKTPEGRAKLGLETTPRK